MDLSDLYEARDDSMVLHVHVQPGAGRSAVVGRHGAALKVRIAAPPIEGRANEATRALLADELGLPEASVEVTGGEHSRSKRFRLVGIDAAELDRRLRLALDRAKPGAGRTTRER